MTDTIPLPELVMLEIPFHEGISKLEDIGDGYYYGTNAFHNEALLEKEEMLTWENCRLFHFQGPKDHQQHWVVIRPDDKTFPGKTLWYYLTWSGGTTRNDNVGAALLLHGELIETRYIAIDRADGFDCTLGFDEIIDAITCVKRAYGKFNTEGH